MFDNFNNNKNSNPAAAPGGQNGAEIYLVSELGRARYEIEHVALRDNFFRAPMDVMLSLAPEGRLFNMYSDLFKAGGLPFRYSKEDFGAEGMNFGDGNLLLRMELPKPEYTHLCYRIYMVCSKNCDRLEYYTIERGMEGGFLCRWDHDQHTLLHNLAEPDMSGQPAVMKLIEIKLIMDMFEGKDAAAAGSGAGAPAAAGMAAPAGSGADPGAVSAAGTGAAAGSAADAEADRTAGLVKAAIRDSHENRGDINKVIKIVELFRDGSFWVPMTISLSEEDRRQFLNVSKGDQVSLKNDARMKPDFLKSGESLFFPAFTDQTETDESYRQRFSWIKLPGEQILSAAMNDETLTGVVINGFSEPFAMTKEIISLAKKDEVEEYTIKKGSVVTFRRINHNYQPLKKAAEDYLRKRPEVRKAFFGRMFVDGKEESFCLVTDGGLKNPQKTFAELNSLLADKTGGHALDFIMFPAVSGQLKASGLEPFYASSTYKTQDSRVCMEKTRLFFMTTYSDSEDWNLGASFDFEKAEDSHYLISGDEAARLAAKLRKDIGSETRNLIVLVHDYLGKELENAATLESAVVSMLCKFDVKYDQFHFY